MSDKKCSCSDPFGDNEELKPLDLGGTKKEESCSCSDPFGAKKELKPLDLGSPKEEPCACSDPFGEKKELRPLILPGTEQKQGGCGCHPEPLKPLGEPTQSGACDCHPKEEKKQLNPWAQAFIAVLALVAWRVLYKKLDKIALWLTEDVLKLDVTTHLGESVRFFLYDVPKVFLLLIFVVYIVGYVRTYFTPQKTRAFLAGKSEFAGNILAAALGIVTPFCSCSAVPLFVGFVSAGIPLGVTFSFLISAPMVNEIALILLYSSFGWKVALIYLVFGFVVAVIAGWIIGKLKMESQLQDWVRDQLQVQELSAVDHTVTYGERFAAAKKAVVDIVGKVWIYIIIGVGVGAGIHGYVPQDFMATLMGKSAWWSVPVAVLIGVPMYTNAAGVIPILGALVGKGAAMGTALAFMMSVIALSLPEMLILKKVLKLKLIAVFVGVVATGILMVGYLFNIIV
ncbi:MAG: permease [Desulfovibrio sp.]